MRLRPAHVPAWVNLSIVQASRGDASGAAASLRSALAAEPGNAAANLDLGLLLAETNRPAEAESALRKALASDPALHQAEYNLCALLANDRPRDAVGHCKRAAALRPESAKYAYAYAFYARRAGDEKSAVATLDALLRRKPADADPYLLLAAIHEEAGRKQEASRVLRLAAANPALSPEARRAIEQRTAARSR